MTILQILKRSINNEAAATHPEWRSLQEEGPPHDKGYQ